MSTENIELIVSGHDKNATGVLKDVQRESGSLGKILKGGLVVGTAAAAVGIGALGAVLKSSVDDAMAAEEAAAQLNATIKSTKGIAGMTAKAVNEQALAFSKLTRFEDDEIAANSAVMLTFTSIGKDIFPRATAASLDLATKFKMQLQPATVMIGKALNDPIKGLTALGKAGVQFTEKQKAMIKAMVEAGDVAGAQKLILAELETQIGGSAEAAGKTAAGQWDIFKNAIGNVKEEIGGALIPVLQKLITWAGPKLIAGFEKFSDWIRRGLVDIEQLAGKLGKAKDIIGDMIRDVQAGKKIDWQDLMNLSGLFTNQLDIQRKFATIVTDIETGIGQIKTAFETGGLDAAADVAWTMFADAIKKGVKEVDWTEVYTEIKRVAGEAQATYSAVFMDENKRAILAWDIQNWIKGAFVIIKDEIDKGNAIDNTALWDSITKALRGPTVSNQEFFGDILDYMFPDVVTAFQPVRDAFESIALSISHIKANLKDARDQRTKFNEELGTALSNPFQGIADVIDTITTAIWNAIGAYMRLKELFAGGASGAGGPSGGTSMPYVPLVTAPNPSPPTIPGAGRSATSTGGATNNFYFDFRGVPGNPDAVRRAAEDGVLRAARSIGLAY